MAEIVSKLLPNVVNKVGEIYKATGETLLMIILAGIISLLLQELKIKIMNFI